LHAFLAPAFGMRMRLSHHPGYAVVLPDGHPFPMSKYTILPQVLLERGIVAAAEIHQPAEAALEDLARVHTADYLAKVADGTLTPAEVRRIGVPWTPQLWRRSRLAVQGTLDAARHALEDGLAGNLAGGTHHAFAGHGEGYCVLNDTVVAIRTLQAERRVRRALVIDLDVHQGNGTAALLAHDPDAFTFSMHGEKNYPMRKERSTLDVELPDGIDDARYLDALAAHLPRIVAGFGGDIAFYLAGVDVARGDRYGRMALTDEGIRARDRYVIERVRDAGIPLVVTLAGGYAPTPQRTSELHAIAFEEARRYAG
jgi:acetoin utilization deacetylase AcuC-like enzyme